MLFIDLSVACLQAIMLVLAYEHVHYGEDADLVDTTRDVDSDSDENAQDSSPASIHFDVPNGAHSPVASSSSSTLDTMLHGALMPSTTTSFH